MRAIFRTLAVLLLVIAALPAFAQSITGTIAGEVKDEQGGALPGATVTLTGKIGTKTTTTGADGTYRFQGLDPGTYSLQVQMSGFGGKRQDNIPVSVGKQATVDFGLKVGNMSESLDVVGEAPLVDVTSSATSNQLSQDLLFNMPIRQGNTATNLLNFVPGINNEAAFGGDAGSGNGLLIDGVDTRDPSGGTAWTFYNYNIVEEVQVQGIGAPAEYGAFTGAIVNTVTKSGGNTPQGLFDIIYTKDSLSGDNVSDSLTAQNPSLGESSTTKKLIDYTGQISGPIKKDKAFYFVSAQRYQKDQDPIGPRTRLNEASNRLNLKLTWQASANDNLVGSLQFDNYNIIGRAGVSSLTDTNDITNREDAPEYVWNTQWRHLFGSKTFLEVKYTGWWGYYDLNPEVKDSQHVDAETGAVTVSQGWNYYADRGRHDLHASVSHYAEAFGHHDLKFGVEVERSKTRDRYNNGLYYYDYGGARYLAYTYSYDVNGRNHRLSSYVQDSWKVTDRLTLNPGVRLDNLKGFSPDGGHEYTNTTIAPRFGFAFDVAGDHKTVLKGSYSQYYERIFNSIYSRATPGISDFVGYDVSACPAYPDGGPVAGLPKCDQSNFSEVSRSVTPVLGLDPDTKHPRVDEFSAGFERAVGNDFRVSVTGIYRDNKNIIGSVNTAARWLPFTTNDAFGNPIQLYQWTNQSESDQSLVITNPDGYQFLDPDGNVLGTLHPQKKYKSLMFVLNKRFTNRWLAQLSYVLAKSYGNIDNTSGGSFGSNSSTNGGGGIHQFETPNVSLVNAYGELTNSPRHELKLMAGWEIPVIDVQVNGYYRMLSGLPYTPYQQFSSRVVSFPASSGGRRIFLEPRGSERRDTQKTLDLRLEKIFKLGSGKDRLAIYSDMTNIFNADTVNGIQRRAPSVSVALPDETVDVLYGSPTSVIDPRVITLGARWSF